MDARVAQAVPRVRWTTPRRGGDTHLSGVPMPVDLLVPTGGCYGVICDAASPVNRPGFLRDLLATGQRDAVRDGHPDSFGLFYVNDALARAAERGELLTWVLILDGVFRARVGIGEDVPVVPPGLVAEPGMTVTADLTCRSGSFLVTSLGALGESREQAAVEVHPGRWRVTVARDLGAEDAHAWLEDPERYPEGDGPDWFVGLRRIG